VEFFDYANPIRTYQGNLPHWHQQGVSYFVTFRLADSIPQEKLDRWRFERENWFSHHAEPYSPEEQREFYFLFSERVQQYLDAEHGACVLRRRDASRIVTGTMRFFDGKRYNLDESIVMPNHVHVLLVPTNGHCLEEILHSWKSYTAHEINKLLGRDGQLWQHESYDHLVRSEKQLHALRRYIRNNPK